MKNVNRCFALLLVVVVAASLPAIVSRWRLESANRETAIVANIVDIEAVAGESGVLPVEAIKQLQREGLTALAVPELTGEDLLEGALPVQFGPAAKFFEEEDGVCDRAVIKAEAGDPMGENIASYVKRKFPLAELRRTPEDLFAVLPVSFGSTAEMGILPDFGGLELAKEAGMVMIFRPGPSPGISGSDAAEAVSWVLERYDPVAAVIPHGVVVPAYPDLDPLVQVLSEREIPVAKVEFSRQIGIASLERKLFPRVLPLHSVLDEEIVVRRITRDELVDRFVRAARERSVRLVYIRPSSLLSKDRLEQMKSECREIRTRIEGLGLKTGWPSTYSIVRTGMFAAFALSLLVLVLLGKTWARFLEERYVPEGKRTRLLAGALVALSVVLAPMLLKVSIAAKVFGAIAAGLGGAEATLCALDGKERPARRLLAGVGVALVTGLAVAAFFGNTWYMLRMATFSGVKLSLLIPPLVVLLHDLRKRVHPESLGQVLSRPPTWGEILLFAMLFGMAGIALLRSGNVSFVPGWEKAFRETLEQLLVARPRTKEFMAGYPSLVLWYMTARMGLWERYREVFRIGGTLAFSSVINSFCHFHTHLFFILLRVANGLWAGVAVGLSIAALLKWGVLPAWKKWGKVFTA